MTAKFDMSRFKPVLVIELMLLAILMFVISKTVPKFLKTTPANKVANEIGLKPNLNASVPKNLQIDTKILRQFDPFHREVKVKTAPEKPMGYAPETTLDLKVFGMRSVIGAGDAHSSSSAIIQTPDGKQTTYFIGDEIIDNVILQSVEIDYVILDRDGTQERLSRQGKAEGAHSVTDDVAMAALSYKVQDMVNDVRFYAFREGREVVGYKVYANRGANLKQYGFKKNDIVTSINGENLAQTRVNLSNIWKNLKTARYASIQIIRDDMPMTIEVNLK